MIFLFWHISTLFHLEPELELFELDDIGGDDGDDGDNGDDDLSYHYIPTFKQLTRVLDELQRNQIKGKSS